MTYLFLCCVAVHQSLALVTMCIRFRGVVCAFQGVKSTKKIMVKNAIRNFRSRQNIKRIAFPIFVAFPFLQCTKLIIIFVYKSNHRVCQCVTVTDEQKQSKKKVPKCRQNKRKFPFLFSRCRQQRHSAQFFLRILCSLDLEYGWWLNLRITSKNEQRFIEEHCEALKWF